jgi:hypothetical protein
MIISFGSKETESIWIGDRAKKMASKFSGYCKEKT